MSGPFGAGALNLFSGVKKFYPYEIDQSLRFNDGSSAYLTRTPSSDGNLDNWTFSAWTKLANADSGRYLLGASIATGKWFHIAVNTSGQIDVRQFNNTSYDFRKISSAVLRDVSAWYHIVVSYDSTNGTAEDRIKVYLNGERITSFGTNENPSSGVDSYVNQNHAHTIGAFVNDNGSSISNYYDGYLGEINLVDGSSLAPTSFGETKEGIWIPKEYSGSYGTNGFYLAFQDTSNFGDDTSGNGNDFTPTGFATEDQVADTPTNNFATFNPLQSPASAITGSISYADGNLYIPTGNRCHVRSTIAVSSGKWYYEFRQNSLGNSVNAVAGVVDADQSATASYNTSAIFYRGSDGHKLVDNTASSFGATYTNGDIIGVALDIDSGDVEFFKNNVSQGTIALSGIGGATTWQAIVGFQSAPNASSGGANFGQDSSFGGRETAQGNSDGNGIGDFYYTPPSGFLALCTDNLPDPGIDPNADENPADYSNTVLWTGDGTTDKSKVISVGFQSDFIWQKPRSSADSHSLVDSVRGFNLVLNSNGTSNEVDRPLRISDVDATSFAVADAASNANNVTNVGWAWKAGGTAVSNTDGSITSSVSASPESGFSVVSYTTTATSSDTVGHGLSSAPELIFTKDRDNAINWVVFTTAIDGSVDALKLNLTDAAVDQSGSPAITATTFTTNYGVARNTIGYCFHSVEGYSKIGSYTGNNSSDGPFVYTGFRPAFVMIKASSTTGNWTIIDNERVGYNIDNRFLYANLPNVESTGGVTSDILSNGFKVRFNSGDTNVSGATYIYMAFAEQPFKYANAR